MNSDEKIMQLVRDGQINKMAILFERYHVRLYNFFYRVNYDQTLSEDLTQNVFERVIRYRSSYNENHSFKSWVFQIARNVKVDSYKSNRLNLADGVDVNLLEVMSNNISDDIAQSETMINLEKAIAQLPEEQREIIMLTRFQKLKYQQVAEMLNCSEGAVKVKVHRAIKKLRKHFFQIDIL